MNNNSFANGKRKAIEEIFGKLPEPQLEEKIRKRAKELGKTDEETEQIIDDVFKNLGYSRKKEQ